MVVRLAAVQASYVLMDREATIDRVAELTAAAARQGAQIVVFPEVFVPGTPIWIDTRPIWDGDDAWFRPLSENAVVIPSPSVDRSWRLAGGRCRRARAVRRNHLQHRSLLFSDTVLVERHRKLVPTGAERTYGDGRWIDPSGGGHAIGSARQVDLLENYMPLAAKILQVRASGSTYGWRGHCAVRSTADHDTPAHSPGESNVRRGDQPRVARRPGPGGFPMREAWSLPDTAEANGTGSNRKHGNRRSEWRDHGRSGP